MRALRQDQVVDDLSPALMRAVEAAADIVEQGQRSALREVVAKFCFCKKSQVFDKADR